MNAKHVVVLMFLSFNTAVAASPEKMVQVEKTAIAGGGYVEVACKDLPTKLMDYEEEIDRLTELHNTISDRYSKLQIRQDIQTMKEAARNVKTALRECL